jgi:hypothetical protein
MKLFSCSTCSSVVFFENVRCTRCGSVLAYLPDQATIGALTPHDGTFVSTLPGANARRYDLCQNSTEYGVCNWAVPVDEGSPYCRGCRLNNIIPDLSHPGALTAWGRIEQAKKRLLYTLLQLGLPVESRQERPDGLVFSFMEGAGSHVLTGHDNGHITLNIAEADNPGRERLRERLGETYRTLLGHFRHEIGHYYWDRLIRGSREVGTFRDLFGDQTTDYATALDRHYAQGPTADWALSFVSAYATAHPWEDWAETWAHYLHIVDTLETARSYGIALRPKPEGLREAPDDLRLKSRRLDFDDFEDLIAAWIPLTLALNSLNRGMGLPDLYPFVLSERATQKLRFVHDVIERTRCPS